MRAIKMFGKTSTVCTRKLLRKSRTTRLLSNVRGRGKARAHAICTWSLTKDYIYTCGDRMQEKSRSKCRFDALAVRSINHAETFVSSQLLQLKARGKPGRVCGATESKGRLLMIHFLAFRVQTCRIIMVQCIQFIS